MSGIRWFWCCALTCAWTNQGFAQGHSFTDRAVPGMRQMDRHNPFSSAYVDLTPGGFSRRHASWPTCDSPCFDDGCFGPSCFGYDCGPMVGFPPLVPARPLFGLGPVLDMLGAAGAAAPGTRWRGPLEDALDKKPLGKLRSSSPEAVARAARYLSAGDEHFGAQRYRDANARYRTATETAPDLVEAFFRQGQALMATGQFELAGKAFKRGLRLGDKWPQAGFNLTEMYGDNQVAKMAHMEAVAAAAEDAPHDGTLLLLVALQLHFDGQPARALPFFRRAATLLADPLLNLDVVQGAAQ